LVFVYFPNLKQHLRPLGFCAPSAKNAIYKSASYELLIVCAVQNISSVKI